MKRNITYSSLKYIAICSMFIDHFPKILKIPALIPYSHLIGRVSFPIFAFLISEGIIKTKNFKKYIIRLITLALISEPLYDIAFQKTLFNPVKQNVIFTLLTGAIMLKLWSKNKNKLKRAIILMAAMIIADIFHLEYGFIGILSMLLFYIGKTRAKKPSIVYLLATAISIINTPLNLWQLPSLLTVPLLIKYNGKKGNYKFLKLAKYFYPSHLLILSILYMCR